MQIRTDGVSKVTFQLSFAATSTPPSPAPAVTCPPPGQSKIDSTTGRAYCVTPCTKDQDLVPGNCTAADCLAKYGAAQGWYNSQTGYCEPIAVCQRGEYLEVTQNRCINLGTTPSAPTANTSTPAAPGSPTGTPPSSDPVRCVALRLSSPPNILPPEPQLLWGAW